ncbi:putative NAD(P)-binding oxidoreductase [Raoultella planticola]|uniref:Putative NAD(P)-binding oxidoreductase n=1 Tax=Raoultella planticola TaxID=575 RepID=A0A485BNZ5_RAOPL|nr:putative NAD(P)-binding oxidoreductase [Raoultella planticola]
MDYAASKGAVDTLTTGLSLEVAAQGIRVNGVRPGLSIPRCTRRAVSPDAWIG